jgi:hypothetical protein
MPPLRRRRNTIQIDTLVKKFHFFTNVMRDDPGADGVDSKLRESLPWIRRTF